MLSLDEMGFLGYYMKAIKTAGEITESAENLRAALLAFTILLLSGDGRARYE